MDPPAVDDIIERLKTGDNRLTEDEIRDLCATATVIFLNEPTLLQLEAPINICGDIRDQYGDLLRIFDQGGYPPTTNYLFLGNYVDGREQSIKTVCLLLAYKIRYPENFFLLRGYHEIAVINFYLLRKFHSWLLGVFNDCFNCLPVAAVVDEKIFCVHAGLSPCLMDHDLTQIENIITRPMAMDAPETGLLFDLLLSDPYIFGQDIVSQFLQRHNLDLICRAHEVVKDGYEFFGDNRQLVTIFSAPNYRGEGNAGAIMSVDENLVCTFQVMTHQELLQTSYIRVVIASSPPGQSPPGELVIPSSPPGELVIPSSGGYGSTSRRSEDTRTMPSFKAFSPKEIKNATNNFSQSLMIGHGGYGKVYKCQLDNCDVAVKILDNQGDQGSDEYIREMEVLGTLRHENLIYLMGTCYRFRALVYEYLPNGSLEDYLKNRPSELTWQIRTRIVYKICTALRFLHGNQPEPVVHGDLKPHNVLLDANFNVKLTDFGLCRFLTQGENSRAFHQTVHFGGSPGYMDPDFLGSGRVTPGVDVFSLGKTVVRILTGQQPPKIFRKVYEAKRRGSFMTVVDPTVRDWPENVVDTLAHFALRSNKQDRNRSEFMEKFYSELGKILDGMND